MLANLGGLGDALGILGNLGLRGVLRDSQEGMQASRKLGRPGEALKIMHSFQALGVFEVWKSRGGWVYLARLGES